MVKSAHESFLKEIQAGFFGDFLIAKGIVKQTDLTAALLQQETATPQLRIGEILVERGAMAPEALLPALKEFRAQIRLGEILIATGQISFVQLLNVLDEQRRSHETFGQTVTRLGYCDPEKVTEALELQRTFYAES
ncbi:MAG: hypothetical protein HY692_06545 [Cyanobacteria bacterium NC_groundwater_1444_Ag_S-0.65um_54_12]|nr:hypothetical protein [Cyanobacteria bacterium NC_groundwater_1444_Ag_S-0.65um_54_12]